MNARRLATGITLFALVAASARAASLERYRTEQRVTPSVSAIADDGHAATCTVTTTSLAAADSFLVVIATPSTGVVTVERIIAAHGATIGLIEGLSDTATTGGASVTPVNVNRDSTFSPTITATVDPSSEPSWTTVFSTHTGSAVGLTPDLPPAHIRLDQSSVFAVRVTNQGASAANASVCILVTVDPE